MRHVESDSANAGSGACQRFKVAIQEAEDAATSGLRTYVNGLDPPKVAVAPIAPFGRVHELAKRPPVLVRDVISALGWVIEESANALQQQPAIKLPVLGFRGDAGVAVDDELEIRKRCGANFGHVSSGGRLSRGADGSSAKHLLARSREAKKA